MALFTYKAIDPRGKSALGQIEAMNVIDLEMRLKRMGLDLISGVPTRRGGTLIRSGSIKRQDLINFCFHLEQLNAAGVPLIESLGDLRDSVESARFREVISGVMESIRPSVISGVRVGPSMGVMLPRMRSVGGAPTWRCRSEHFCSTTSSRRSFIS